MKTAATPAFALRGISKRFGWTWALRSVDLELGRGASLALVGPNGAGKTTLLKLLSTVYGPSGGEGEVLGHPLAGDSDPIRRRVVLLAGHDYLYDELTGRENLRFAARMSGIPDDEERREGALRRVGMERAADRRVRTYSSGMRKRLALARLLLRQADLILLDEPYASLDRDGVRLVDRIVRERRESGASVVLASHQPGEALRTADRAVRLRRGRIRELPAGADPLGHPGEGADAGLAGGEDGGGDESGGDRG